VATPVNQAVLFEQQNFTAAAAKTSSSVIFRGTQGEILYFFSDTAGTYVIQIKVANSWRQVGEGKVKVNKVKAVDIKFFVPELRIIFTPDSAPAVLDVEVFGYPLVFVRDKQGNVLC
jgi:hypothetical protein